MIDKKAILDWDIFVQDPNGDWVKIDKGDNKVKKYNMDMSIRELMHLYKARDYALKVNNYGYMMACLDELLEWANEYYWEVEVDVDYYVPHIGIKEEDRYFVFEASEFRNNNKMQKYYELGMLCRTKEEAIAKANEMMGIE